MKKTHRLFAVFAGAALLVALGAAALFWVFGQIEQSALARRQSFAITIRAADWLADMIDADTGQRGFALTGDAAFLEPYLAAQDSVSRELEELRQLTKHDEARRHLDAVRPLLEAKMAELARVIELRRDGDMTAVTALIAGGEGKRLMDSIRAEIKGFIQIENLALARDDAQLQSNLRRMFIGIVTVTVCTLLFGVLVAYQFYRNNEHQLKNLVLAETQRLLELQAATAGQLAAIVTSSDDAIIGKNLIGVVTSWNAGAENSFGYTSGEMVGQSMTRLIPPDRQREEVEILARIGRGESVRHFDTVRLHKDGRAMAVSVTVSPIKDAAGKIVGASKVVRDISERKLAEDQIHRLNAELERRVIERTAELETANTELESFSYSVSHDLRTPVRAIDGFSEAALEDYGPLLPAEGRRYLQTIRHSAQQMGQLIDDLLAFAQIKRLELKRRPINTGELVREALGQLGAPWPERKLTVRVADLPGSSGDPALLKQVWINLLSNALKYTRKRDQAELEIGCMKVGGADTFFVRDNGTGFDMRYADKLFGVFQRFHRAEDYEGTGVGLAIVQRIVQRHGGRIWADAAVDRGATFYFTLEKETRP